MSTRTLTLQPENLRASAQLLNAEFLRAKLQGVETVAAKGSFQVKMDIDRLRGYRFAFDAGRYSWTTAKQRIVLQANHFDIEQRLKGKTFLIEFKVRTEAKHPAIKKSDRVREIFYRRSLRAIEDLQHIDQEQLIKAVQAPTDYSVLLSALSADEALATNRTADPLAGARLRGLAAKRSLLESEGGTLASAEVAQLLGISRQAVDKRRGEGRLLAVQLGRKGYRYPVWQFGLKGMDKALRALEHRDVWDQLSFFLNPSAALEDRTPLDVLQAGEKNLPAVLKAASAYGEQGG